MACATSFLYVINTTVVGYILLLIKQPAYIYNCVLYGPCQRLRASFTICCVGPGRCVGPRSVP